MHFLRSPSLLSSLSCLWRTGAESSCSCSSPAAAAPRRSVPSARTMRLPSFLPLSPTRRCRKPDSPPPLFGRQLLPRLRQPLLLSAAPAAQPDTPETHTEQRTTSKDECMVSHWRCGEGWRSVPLPSSSWRGCRPLRRSPPPSVALSAAPLRQPIDTHHATHRRDWPLHTCFPPLAVGLTCREWVGGVPPSGSGSCSACSRSQPLALGGCLLPLHRP
jgi:hypothetical protein